MKGIDYLFKTSLGEGPIKNNQVRKLNLKQAVIRELYYQKQLSIHQLGKTIKMSTPTITRAIEELVAAEMVRETGIGESTGGRRPSIYGLHPSSRYVLGIDLERFFIRIGIFDFDNKPVAEILQLNEGLETHPDIPGFLAEKVNELIQTHNIERSKILGIGISLPGLIDIRSGISYTYLNTGKPTAGELRQKLGLPVFLEQDTRAMVWGEQAFGLAKGHQNVLCLNIGSGIGLSMILGGKIYTGHSGYSGEFGHIQIESNGQLCHCGKIGCIETVASGKVMINKARKDLEQGAISLITGLIDGDLSKINIRIILDAARQGDQYSIDLLARIGESLGKGLSTLIHLFNPELIIIGGEMSIAANYIVAPIESNLNIFTIARIRKDAVIVSSELGDNARIMGTVALVMNKILG